MLMSGPQFQSSSSRGRGRGRVIDSSDPPHNRPGSTYGKTDSAQSLAQTASLSAGRQESPRLGARGRARPRKPEQQLYVPRGRRDQEGQSSSKPAAPISPRASGQDSGETPAPDSFKPAEDAARTPGQCVLKKSEQESFARSAGQRPSKPASSKTSKKIRADAQVYVPRGRRKLDAENVLETKKATQCSSSMQVSPPNERVEQQNHEENLEHGDTEQNGVACVDMDITTLQSSANVETDICNKTEPVLVPKSDHDQTFMVTDMDSSDLAANQQSENMDLKDPNQDYLKECALPVSAATHITESEQYFPCNSDTNSCMSKEHENANKIVPTTESIHEHVIMAGRRVSDAEVQEDECSAGGMNVAASTQPESEFSHSVPPSHVLPPQADSHMELSSENIYQNLAKSESDTEEHQEQRIQNAPLISEQCTRQEQEEDKESESVLIRDESLASSAEVSVHHESESPTRQEGVNESEICNVVEDSFVNQASESSASQEIQMESDKYCISENSTAVCHGVSDNSQRITCTGDGGEKQMPSDSEETASHKPVQVSIDNSLGEAGKSDEECKDKDVDHSGWIELNETASRSSSASTAIHIADTTRTSTTHSENKATGSGDACSLEAPSSTRPDEDEEEDEDSWDKMFDDNGDCLDPSVVEELTAHVGEVEISRPKKTINYLDYQPKEPDMDVSAYSHVIEISDFPAEFQTRDLLTAFKDFINRGFDLKWVDDTHALGVFSSTIAAMDALKMVHPMMKLKPLSEGSKQSRSKARRIQEFLQPYKARPVTSAAAARRLVTGALGMTPRISKEQRDEERKLLKEARDKKRQDRKQKEAIWDGDIGKCAMDSY